MLLGYKEWTWDETEVWDSEHCGFCEEEQYPCDIAYEEYADWKIGELLPELSAELMGKWDYGYAVGYVGWMNSFGQTKVKEVDSVFLKYMVFDTINDSNITVKLDFTHVDKGVIVMRRSHHDRPMGETLYIFQSEEDEIVLTEEELNEKLYELGLKERPITHTVVITSGDTTVGEWEVV